MFHKSDTGTYLYFIIINAEAYLIDTKPLEEPDLDGQVYLDTLNDLFQHFPNWEAVGASTFVEYREDRQAVRSYTSGNILYDYKMKMKPHILDVAKKKFPISQFEWVELPENSFDSLHGAMTFTRDDDGKWEKGNAPVERAIFASKTSDVRPKELGNPGGPCKIIKNIEEEGLPDRVKEDLKQDIYQDEKLENDEASQIYDRKSVRLDSDIIPQVTLTSHVQYRMDFRSITIDAIKSAFQEFERWYKHKKKNKDSLSFEEMDKLQDLTYGDPIQFDADKMGLTLIFRVDQKTKEAHLISSWWSGKPNPSAPEPGECKPMTESSVMSVNERYATQMKNALEHLPCLHKKGCGCDCPCENCGGGSKSKDPQEEHLDDSNWYENSQKSEFNIRTEEDYWE